MLFKQELFLLFPALIRVYEFEAVNLYSLLLLDMQLLLFEQV